MSQTLVRRPRPVTATLLTAAGATLAGVVLAAFPLLSSAAGIDPNTFIVGHPASPTWKATPVVHANGEHPAVLQARALARAGVDANTFIVQPPASTRWLAAAPVEAATVAALSPADAAAAALKLAAVR